MIVKMCLWFFSCKLFHFYTQMNTDKKGVRLIAEICQKKGIRKAVFSPGSRSAPLVIAFSQIAEIECIVIPDERVAGYFALGMAQQLREPVVVVCTSGTAVLNLAPAVCEAYYQYVPLLVLTADRLEGAAMNGENQAIEQSGVMEEFTITERDIDGDAETKEEIDEVAEVMLYSFEILQKTQMPAHINIRMDEPLYMLQEVHKPFPSDIFNRQPENDIFEMRNRDVIQLTDQLVNCRSILVVVGSHYPDRGILKNLSRLSARQDVVILTETLSNTVSENFISNYDSCLALIPEVEEGKYKPDMIVTMGNTILSKRLRKFFIKNKPTYYCDVGKYNDKNFFQLERCIYSLGEEEVLECLLKSRENKDSNLRSSWKELDTKSKRQFASFRSQLPFCDLKVFETLVQSFPANANIQYGNSTPIRYANFFDHRNDVAVNANRGTSGIDGCVSTAAGAAYANGKLTVIIVGDVSFFYDSNALWNNYLSTGLRIVIINNSGGNIFRLIDGPNRVSDFEKFFETRHNLTAKHLASMYDLPYYICARQNELEEALETFYEPSDKPKILEIKTDGDLSATVYRQYFESLSSSK